MKNIFNIISILILLQPNIIVNAQCTYTATPTCGSTVTTFASGQTLNSVICYTPATFTTSTIATLALGNSGGAPGAGSLTVSNADLTITSLTFNGSYAGALYISSGATVRITNAVTLPSVTNSRIVNRGTLIFSAGVTINQNATVQTAISTANTTFSTGFTIPTGGVLAYMSKGTTTTTGGTVTAANNNICLDQNSFWNAAGFSFSTGAGQSILNVSSAHATINYSGTISNAGGGSISGSSNLKLCRNGGTPACSTITGIGSVTCSETACSNPLPVVFTNFSGFPNNNGINLSWTTAQEYNNDYFVVERSYDGINFDVVKTIKGKGTTTNSTTYLTFDDDANILKPVYYRLKQVDFDGKFSYSSIIFINEDESKQGFTIYPNPVEDIGTTLFAKFYETDINDYANVSLFDATGKEIQKYSIENIQSDFVYSIKDENLFIPQGSYYLKIVTKSRVYNQKVVIK